MLKPSDQQIAYGGKLHLNELTQLTQAGRSLR